MIEQGKPDPVVNATANAAGAIFAYAEMRASTNAHGDSGSLDIKTLDSADALLDAGVDVKRNLHTTLTQEFSGCAAAVAESRVKHVHVGARLNAACS